MPAIDNKRIARNAILMYIRMVVSMFVGLFTSRIVLQQLGEVDFGVYNVIAGIIVIFSYISSSFASSSSRFISYALGEGDEKNVSEVFATLLFVNIGFCIISLFLGETVGLWYVLHILKYPEALHDVVMVIYQVCIISMCFNILAIPFTSMIIARERMEIYAYITLFDVFAKLGIAISLIYLDNKLEIYAVMQGIVSLSLLILYYIISKKRKFINSLSLRYNKKILKEILKFCSWIFVGGISNIMSTQGINLLLNYVFGVIINTAYGLTMQIQNAVRSLSLSFQMALNPQLIKSYASGNIVGHRLLIFRSMRFSFYLILILSLPIYFNVAGLLEIWLGKYPEATIAFVKWILLANIVSTLANPLGVSVEASGKIKKISLYTSIALASVLPISWIVLKVCETSVVPFVVFLCGQILCLIIKLHYAMKVSSISFSEIFNGSFKYVLFVGGISYLLCCGLSFLIPNTYSGTLLNVILCLLISIMVSFILGFQRKEKIEIVRIIKNKTLHRFCNENSN